MFLQISKNKSLSAQLGQKPLKSNSKAIFQAKNVLSIKQDEISFKRYIDFKHPFPFKKLEGIQKGIKVFEGLSLKQIFFVGQNLNYIPLQRGCRNLCTHCFRAAEVPKKLTADTVNSILWEDFLSLTSGVKDLKQRVGADFFQQSPFNHNIKLFLDSEMINAKVKDKKGGIHDASEAVEVCYDALKTPLMVDTAGWHKNDEYTRNAAQKLTKFFTEKPEALYHSSVDVSVNPFHSIIEQSFKLAKKDPKKAQELRSIYTSRMAEALETFLPCGVFAATRVTCEGSHSHEFQRRLNQEILEKMEKSLKGANLPPKTKLNFGQLKTTLQQNYFDEIFPVGRAESFFKHHEADNLKSDYLQNLDVRMKKHNNFYDLFLEEPKIVDVNGKVYVGNSVYTQDTGIQLNFENKDKKTPVIHNYLEDKPKFCHGKDV